MPSEAAVDFVTARARRLAHASDKAGTEVRPTVLRTAETVGQAAAVDGAAMRQIDGAAAERGDALGMVAARRAMADVPEVAGAGSQATLRSAPDSQTLQTEDGLDAFNMKPGTAEYAAAIRTNSTVKRLLKDGTVVEVEEPLQMVPGVPSQTPAVAEVAAPEAAAVAPVATVTHARRVIFSFGPQPGTMVVGVEDPVEDEVLVSVIVDTDVVRAFKPILMLLARCKDMTGTLNQQAPASAPIELGPASQPEEKPRARKSA